MLVKYWFLIIVVLTINGYAQYDSLYLRLPDYIYTTTSSEYTLFYNNTLLAHQTPETFSYIVDCPVGYPDSMKYNLD